jgi:hypothetical protein
MQYTCSDDMVWNSWSACQAHVEQVMDTGTVLSWSSRDIYTTVHHPAVTHVVHHEAVYKTIHHAEVRHWEE